MPSSNALGVNGKPCARPKPKLKWTLEMRQTLHILWTELSYTAPEQERIFNEIFNEHVKQRGLVKPVLYKTLNSQWVSRLDHRRENPHWKVILAPPSSEEDRSCREAIRARIWEAAESLGDVQTPSASKASQARPPPSKKASSTPKTSEPQLPLSKQAPIASWNPPGSDDSDDSDGEWGAPPRKRRRAASPMALIVRTPAQIKPKKSPRSKKTQRSELDTVIYPRPRDVERGYKPIRITQETWRLSQRDLVPVQEDQAHPSGNILLFRYYNQEAGAERHNSTGGFLARKLSDTVKLYQPAPRCTELNWYDLYNHLAKRPFQSPFISTSNCFSWILRKALREAKEGTSTGRIAVIDASRLDRKIFFCAIPYQQELKKKLVYYDGQWNYGGKHEFLVWEEIPGSAIINTFEWKDLNILVNSNPAVDRLFRFDIFGQHGSARDAVIRQLKQSKVTISPKIAAAIAEIAHVIGLGPYAEIEQHSHLVTDLIQGFYLHLTKRTGNGWRQLAKVYAQTFQINNPHLQIDDQRQLMAGLLYGCRLGSSKSVNTKLSPLLIGRMNKQAKLLGLENTAEILCKEVDPIEFMIWSQETQIQRLSAPASQINLAASSRKALSASSISTGECDSDEHDNLDRNEDNDGEVYEITDDGYVV